MNKYEVRITDDAIHDMDGIYQYIAHNLQSPRNALNQYNRIADAIISLEYYPEKYALLNLEPEHSRGIRKMIIDNYLVFYIIDSNKVIVINVLYSKADTHNKLNSK